jgi:hypothetical protein
LEIYLYNMPSTGPWESGFVQPAIPEGKTREGRFLPGQLVQYDFTQMPDRRKLAYIVAPLDRHDYLVVYGHQDRMPGRARDREWAPTIIWGGGVFSARRSVTLYRSLTDGDGNECASDFAYEPSNYRLATRKLERMEIQPGWAVPTEAKITDYQEVREAIGSRF